MAFASGAQAGEVTLEDEVAPLIKRLSRPVEVFHWTSRERIGMRDPNGVTYVRRAIDQYWQPSGRPEGSLGNGFYAATDPVASRPAFRTDWALLRVKLPKGFRFLDLRAPERGAAALPARTLERLKSQDCKAKTLPEVFEPSSGPLCRGIAADTLKAQQLDGVLYESAVGDFALCPKRPGAAFLVVDGARFVPDGLTAFTGELPKSTGTPDPLAEDRLVLQALFKDARGRGSRPLPWEELGELHPMAKATLAAYVESSVFGCGSYEEDRFPDRETATSLDFQQLLRRFGSVDPLKLLDRKLGRDAEAVRRAARMEQPLTAEVLRSVTTPGTERYAKAVSRETALEPEAVDAIQFFKFKGEDTLALKWVDLKCQEELPEKLPLPGDLPECRRVVEQAGKLAAGDAVWAKTRSELQAGTFKDQWYWHACWPRAEASRPVGGKYCGMIVFPDAESVERRLRKILARVADYFSPSTERTQTPLRFALETQRELLALQPFGEDGGRAAQAAADYILIRAGLPTTTARPGSHTIRMPEEKFYRMGLEAVFEAVSQMRALLTEKE